MLRRVFYVSEISGPTTPVNVRAIVSSSIVWNRRHDVTGLLVASQRNFAQVLEGREDQIAEVLGRIRRDTHHQGIRIQVDDQISIRLFARWSMAYVYRGDLAEQLARLHEEERGASEKEALLDELAKAGNDVASDL